MKVNESQIDEAYKSLAASIPSGTSNTEAFRAACRLVGDTLGQMSGDKYQERLLDIAKSIIEIEYKKVIDKSKLP